MPATPNGVHSCLQRWINLPSSHKMTEPMYKEIAGQDIPETTQDGAKLRVLSGEGFRCSPKSQIHTITPTMFLDITLSPHHTMLLSMYKKRVFAVFILSPSPSSSPAFAHQLLLLGRRDGLKAWNKSGENGVVLRFVLVGGEPLAQFGSFVMNTNEEIDQTIEDFEKEVNGFEQDQIWKSQVLSSLPDEFS